MLRVGSSTAPSSQIQVRIFPNDSISPPHDHMSTAAWITVLRQYLKSIQVSLSSSFLHSKLLGRFTFCFLTYPLPPPQALYNHVFQHLTNHKSISSLARTYQAEFSRIRLIAPSCANPNLLEPFQTVHKLRTWRSRVRNATTYKQRFLGAVDFSTSVPS